MTGRSISVNGWLGSFAAAGTAAGGTIRQVPLRVDTARLKGQLGPILGTLRLGPQLVAELLATISSMAGS
jgi:hypothetical protein